MKKNSEYVVRFSELKDDTETFEFSLRDTFFKDFQSNEWESGRVNVVVDVIKRPDGITIDFEMKGELTVLCDRCLDAFAQPVNFSQRLFVKYGQEPKELDDNMVIIPREENQIDLAGYFYEYLLLSMPVKRVHPNRVNGESGCNKEMLKKLKQHIVNNSVEDTDPRWDALKRLIDKN
ncbi:MAG: DUF177 domain-containing protein [Bacteroidales bacterium]